MIRRTALPRLPFVRRLVVLAIASYAGPASAQLAVTTPEEYTRECRIERESLTATVLARNSDVYPDVVTRTSGGWLVHDRFARQIIELDDSLTIVRRWGRRGPGPLEYENPVAVLQTSPDQVVVLDRSPPSIITFGDGAGERRLEGVMPVHAIFDGGRILVSARRGTLHEVTVLGEIRNLLSRHDFGLPVQRGDGARPIIRLRPGHLGFLGPSTIWVGSSPPRQIVQRCLHDDLANVHLEAPKVDLGPPFGIQPYTVHTMLDFLHLGDGAGFLVLGGLVVDEDDLRSIERYDETGRLVKAWRLTGYPRVSGVFDNHNNGRMLLWNAEEIDGIVLVALDGEGFPGPPARGINGLLHSRDGS